MEEAQIGGDQATLAPISRFLPALSAETDQGLTEREAHRRLQEYGYNEIPERRINPLAKFFSYFWGPIPWMIETAAILSAVLRHWADLVIILVLLIVNALVGFWEE